MTDFPKKPARKFGNGGKKPFSKPFERKEAPKKSYAEMKKATAEYKAGMDNYTPPLDHHSAYLIFGRHPSVLSLQNKNRIIKKLVCSQNGYNFLQDKIDAETLSKLPYDIVDIRKLDSMLPADSNHQGIILVAEPLIQPTIESVLDGDDKLVVLLDQITDPHNVGAIIRSAAAFGATAVITTERSSPPENAIIIKTSAGMFETTPYIRGGNLNDAILQLKKAGFYVVGLDGDAETDIAAVTNKAGRYAVIIGGEGRGMRQLVKENCDILAKINISEQVESLNASVAAAVALFAISSIIRAQG